MFMSDNNVDFNCKALIAVASVTWLVSANLPYLSDKASNIPKRKSTYVYCGNLPGVNTIQLR